MAFLVDFKWKTEILSSKGLRKEYKTTKLHFSGKSAKQNRCIQ